MCGESYRLARLLGLPQRPNIPAVMGKVFHTVSEEVDRLIHDQTHRGRGAVQGTNQLVSAVESLASETLVIETQSTVDSYGPVAPNPTTGYLGWLHYGKQTYEVWVESILPRTIENYIEWRLNSGYSLLELPGFGPAIEVPFLIDLDGTVIRGYVDRVFVDNKGTPLVFDLKSGKKPETIEQLCIYRVALETLYGRDFRWGAYLYDIKGGYGGPTFAGPYDLNTLLNADMAAQYKTADALIDLGLFVAKPQEFCFHCGVAEHCKFVKARA